MSRHAFLPFSPQYDYVAYRPGLKIEGVEYEVGQVIDKSKLNERRLMQLYTMRAIVPAGFAESPKPAFINTSTAGLADKLAAEMAAEEAAEAARAKPEPKPAAPMKGRGHAQPRSEPKPAPAKLGAGAKPAPAAKSTPAKAAAKPHPKPVAKSAPVRKRA